MLGLTMIIHEEESKKVVIMNLLYLYEAPNLDTDDVRHDTDFQVVFKFSYLFLIIFMVCLVLSS